MRRGISIAMLIFGIWTMFTGIWEFFPPFNEEIEPFHFFPAFIFTILLIIHVWLNRKPTFRYFKKLGWRWIPICLGIIFVFIEGIVFPIFVVMGE